LEFCVQVSIYESNSLIFVYDSFCMFPKSKMVHVNSKMTFKLGWNSNSTCTSLLLFSTSERKILKIIWILHSFKCVCGKVSSAVFKSNFSITTKTTFQNSLLGLSADTHGVDNEDRPDAEMGCLLGSTVFRFGTTCPKTVPPNLLSHTLSTHSGED